MCNCFSFNMTCPQCRSEIKIAVKKFNSETDPAPVQQQVQEQVARLGSSENPIKTVEEFDSLTPSLDDFVLLFGHLHKIRPTYLDHLEDGNDWIFNQLGIDKADFATSIYGYEPRFKKPSGFPHCRKDDFAAILRITRALLLYDPEKV